LKALQDKAADGLRASNVAMVAGRAIANLIRNHLFKLDAERANSLGGKRSHFYADAARSVSNPIQVDESAVIDIAKQGLAQRYFGGTIKAGQGTSSATGGPTKYLAIPARSEAYGRVPGEFTDLSFVPTARGGMLVQNLQTPISVGRGKTSKVKYADTKGGLVMFWLVTEVTQAPDPTVLPTETQMTTEGVMAGESYLARQLGSR
jgi:hypothetical protein